MPPRLHATPGDAVRELVRETRLSPRNLILPLFARTGKGVRQPISSMPGHAQFSVDLIADEARSAKSLGLGGIILFGIPNEKDATGSDSYCEHGIVQQAIKAAKEGLGSDFVTWVLLVVHGANGGTVGQNDLTVEIEASVP